MTEGSFSNPIALLIYMQIPTNRYEPASSEDSALNTEDRALTAHHSPLTTHNN